MDQVAGVANESDPADRLPGHQFHPPSFVRTQSERQQSRGNAANEGVAQGIKGDSVSFSVEMGKYEGARNEQRKARCDKCDPQRRHFTNAPGCRQSTASSVIRKPGETRSIGLVELPYVDTTLAQRHIIFNVNRYDPALAEICFPLDDSTQIFEGSVTLEVGQRISGVLDTSTLAQRVMTLTDVLVEDDLKERETFEGAPDETTGWTPGIATNLQRQRRHREATLQA
jgi:hypothetical protein